MADPAKTLDVGVKITGDPDGAAAAERQIEGVGVAAEKASQQVEKLSKTQVQDNLDALRQQRSDAAKQSLWELGQNDAMGLAQQAEAAAKSTKALSDLKMAGESTGRVFSGLAAASQGGIRGIVGLANAARGAVGLFRTLSTVLMGPVGLALGATAAAIAAVGRITRQNQEYIEKVFAGAKASAEAYANTLETMKEVSSRSFESQIRDVSRFKKAVGEGFDREDSAQARSKAVEGARRAAEDAALDRAEQEAIARAPTKEQEAKQRGLPPPSGNEADGDSEARAKIRSEFQRRRREIGDARATVDIDNEVMQAKLKADNAEKAMQQVQAQQTDLINELTNAERAAADAAAEALRVAGTAGRTSDVAVAAAKYALAAREALEDRRKKIEEVSAELAAIAATAELRRADFDLLRETAPLRRQALQDETTTRDAKETMGDREKLKSLQQREVDLQGKLNLSAARRFETGETSDNSSVEKELAASQKEMRRLQLAIQAHAKETTNTVGATTKAVNKWTVQVRNNRP